MKTTFKYVLVLALAGFVSTGCATHRCCKSQQWEYKRFVLAGTKADLSKLNEFGKDGWQLVSVVPATIDDYTNADKSLHDVLTATYIFKRPIQ